MIEIVSAARCIDCDKCVEVCPTNVFDAVEGGHPVIARQSDCQTCFMCEAYCPVDALFVAPLARRPTPTRSSSTRTAAERGPVRGVPRVDRLGHGRRPGSLRDRNPELLELVAPLLPDVAVQ